jgi:hypothetical protein
MLVQKNTICRVLLLFLEGVIYTVAWSSNCGSSRRKKEEPLNLDLQVRLLFYDEADNAALARGFGLPRELLQERIRQDRNRYSREEM